MPREGILSSFSATGTVDSFDQKTPEDLILAADWNKLGDAVYNTQQVLLEMKAREQASRFNSQVRFWTDTFSPTWGQDILGQLSCTGIITIPVSACIELGTFWPVQHSALVKVQTRLDITDSLRYFRGANITSAIYCPSCTSLNPYVRTYTTPPDNTFDPINPSAHWRTIIVGLYFDGQEVPSNINSLGIKCDVFISLPG
jgi:hypothetical protein